MEKETTSWKTYFFVYLALMVLLGSTLGASYLPLGPFHPAVSLGIAITKALLVILFFMHVRVSAHLTSVYAIAGFVWLAILISLTLADYLTR